MTEALFTSDGDTVTPGELCRGPWDPRHCHGGPIAAMTVRHAERIDDSGLWQIARMTLELVRPVEVGQPFQLHAELERPGRKVSLVGVTLRSGRDEVGKARLLRIRDEPLELPDDDSVPDPIPMAPPDTGVEETPAWPSPGGVTFHADACEHRAVAGSWSRLGPAEMWIRLRVPLLADERPSGVQRAAAAADFGNGASYALPFATHVFINPDLTVHLSRCPRGDWIGLRAESVYGDRGAGFAEAALFDEQGRVGRSVQSLFVAAR